MQYNSLSCNSTSMKTVHATNMIVYYPEFKIRHFPLPCLVWKLLYKLYEASKRFHKLLNFAPHNDFVGVSIFKC